VPEQVNVLVRDGLRCEPKIRPIADPATHQKFPALLLDVVVVIIIIVVIIIAPKAAVATTAAATDAGGFECARFLFVAAFVVELVDDRLVVLRSLMMMVFVPVLALHGTPEARPEQPVQPVPHGHVGTAVLTGREQVVPHALLQYLPRLFISQNHNEHFHVVLEHPVRGRRSARSEERVLTTGIMSATVGVVVVVVEVLRAKGR
jgi:hypothetical protein